MKVIPVEQGSPEWLLARCGKVTGSRIDDVCAKLKNGTYGASRDSYMGQVIAERLTGRPADTYQSQAMAWGNDIEPMARAAYQFDRMIPVERVGFVLHPHIRDAGCSPDGLLGDRGMVQFKCPLTHTHISYLLAGGVPAAYQKQMQWEMACCERQWSDFVSFDPRMPAHMQLFVKRLHRDDQAIRMLEREAELFLAEVERKLEQLGSIYKEPKP